eukprot:455867-Lingulodinium_polyedra.AAC.1
MGLRQEAGSTGVCTPDRHGHRELRGLQGQLGLCRPGPHVRRGQLASSAWVMDRGRPGGVLQG